MAHVVARIGKPHGIRGEVTVQVHTDDPSSRFVAGAVFMTAATAGSGAPRELTLASARDHNGIWLLSFEGIPDRTGAEGLRGTRLLLDEDVEPALQAADSVDEWYPEDLIGLQVVDTDDRLVGTVAAVETGAAQDLLVVRLPDERLARVPFVSQLVPEVDLPGRRVVVDLPPGLLDLAE